MATYIESKIRCDVHGCKNHGTATLIVRGINQNADLFGATFSELPPGWAFKRVKWWHLEEALLCQEHNK